MTKKNIFDLIEEDEDSFLYTLDGFELQLYNILESYFCKDKFTSQLEFKLYEYIY